MISLQPKISLGVSFQLAVDGFHFSAQSRSPFLSLRVGQPQSDWASVSQRSVSFNQPQSACCQLRVGQLVVSLKSVDIPSITDQSPNKSCSYVCSVSHSLVSLSQPTVGQPLSAYGRLASVSGRSACGQLLSAYRPVFFPTGGIDWPPTFARRRDHLDLAGSRFRHSCDHC